MTSRAQACNDPVEGFPLLPTRTNVEVFRACPPFASLAEGDLLALTACFRGQTYATDEPVFRQGDAGTSLYMVAEGTLVASVQQRDARSVEINRMNATEIFGEMALLDPAPRSATVTAATPSTVYELHADGLATLREQSPAAACALVSLVIRDATRRLRRLDHWVERELTRLAESAGQAPTRSLVAPHGEGT